MGPTFGGLVPGEAPETLFLFKFDTNDETVPPLGILGLLENLGPRTLVDDCAEVFLLSETLPLPRITSSGGVGLRDPNLVGDGLPFGMLLL